MDTLVEICLEDVGGAALAAAAGADALEVCAGLADHLDEEGPVCVEGLLPRGVEASGSVDPDGAEAEEFGVGGVGERG